MKRLAVLLFQLVLSANSAFGTICNGNTSTITFTTDSANSSAGTIGPASIDGYGNLSSSCYNVPGATCEVVLCDMDSMTVRMGSQNGWKFTITGDIGDLLASEEGAVEGHTFPAWLKFGDQCYRDDWQTYDLFYSNCGTLTQSDYRGDISTTEAGVECQQWDEQSPHEHTRTPAIFPSSGLVENYCRNPDGQLRAWCYTTDPNKRWDFCKVPTCEDNVRNRQLRGQQ
uniref:Kringle domain-containing protein n=1 Tax=Chaetoceros debilis TaxID=122233 RepID=A0A7S3QCG1_9STRA